MPTRQRIKEYWNNTLVAYGKFDKDEIFQGDYCFACGYDNGPTIRAHIQAKCNGGPDEVENLHLLCPCCHRTSEFLEGDKYWHWFKERSIIDMIVQDRTNTGLNLGHLILCK
jgi:5-methylcytosine-specific restriction endonuclease McrA